jgi:predicted membrane chloride channel (bestrophin family)
MSHHCHWPGCKSTVPPSLWGCRDHWYTLPKHIRDLIWANYKPGQEVTKTPSVRYIEAARLAHDWALRYELRKKEQETVLKGIEELGEEIA